MAGQRAAELSSPGAVQPAAGAGTPRSLRQELPTRSGQHQRGAACAPRQPPHLIPSPPIPSRPGKQCADFPNSPKCGWVVRLPRVSATVRSRPRRSALPCPTLRGTRGRSRPSPRARRRRGSGGTPCPRRRPALPPAEQMRRRRAEPLQPQAAPSPAAHPALLLRSAPCGARCGARRSPRRAPSRGSPVFLGTYRPARRGRDRQRGRRNHVGLRDGYNTFYLEKHYITLRDVTWDS